MGVRVTQREDRGESDRMFGRCMGVDVHQQIGDSISRAVFSNCDGGFGAVGFPSRRGTRGHLSVAACSAV